MKNIILIPYRNREEHLKYWIENTYPKLNNNLGNLEVLIIEQLNDDKLFNRGKLLNIGFKYYDKDGYNYFTHDVDLNPINNNIFKIYNKKVENNNILGIYTSAYNTLGGIIKFNGFTFKKINGFTNEYWGWGCEDKNLQNRANFYNIKINKNILNNDDNRYKYFKIFDDVDDRKKNNINSKTNF